MNALVEALGPAADTFDRAWLEQLRTGIRMAQEKYPDVRLPPAAFERHVAELVRGMPEPCNLYLDDVYLAFAIGHADASALGTFEREHLREVPLFLGKYRLDEDQLSEVLQRIRERLLVAEVGKPRIFSYAGQGRLGGWVRMVAVRTALDYLRSTGQEPDARELGGGVVLDPELAFVKAKYAAEFRAAMQVALRELSDRDATILRLRYAQDLDTAKIGRVYRVSGRTVQRWLSAAHEQIARTVRRELARGEHLSERELQSLLDLVESQLDFTLGELIRST